MNTWKAIFAALVIFGAGFVTGNVVRRVSDTSKAPTAMTPRTTPRSPQQALPLEQLRRIELMGCVQKELDLTPEQHAHIEKIIGDGQEHIRDLWDQVAPDIRDEYEDVKEKLCDQLTPEQNKRFDELMKQQMHSHRPPGTNMPPQAIKNQKKSDA